MPEGYYCPKCDKFVSADMAAFDHPDMGEQSCLRCRKCGHMVYTKEQPGDFLAQWQESP